MAPLTELLATLTAGLFAGAAAYITLVEHPARVSCGPGVAVTEFRPSHQRATVMQVALAVVGTLAALARWGAVGGIGWLIGGLLFGAVIPFTLIVIFPTNKRACLTWISPHRRSDRCWTAGGRSTPSAVRTVGLQPRMVLRRFHARQD